MRTTTCFISGALLMLFVSPASGQTGTDRWQVGTAPSFSSGKYGTDARTEVLHTPITARRLFEDGDVSVVFPVTCIRGIGDVTVVNGSPVRTEQSRLGSTTGNTGRPGASDSGSRGGDRKSTRLNSSHLGISYAVFC